MFAPVLAFAALAALLVVTPGLDTMLVLRSTLASGRRAGLLAGVGACSGILVWGVASAVGITALLSASRTAFEVLRLAGAGYLMWLGLRTFWRARREAGANAGSELSVVPRRLSPGEAFRNGLFSDLLNPKVGVFYATVLPQFIPVGAPVLALSVGLAAINAAEGLLWVTLLALMAGRLRGRLTRGRLRARLEQVSAVAFLGFGLRLALERI